MTEIVSWLEKYSIIRKVTTKTSSSSSSFKLPWMWSRPWW
jgi:hypothetical protein